MHRQGHLWSSFGSSRLFRFLRYKIEGTGAGAIGAGKKWGADGNMLVESNLANSANAEYRVWVDELKQYLRLDEAFGGVGDSSGGAAGSPLGSNLTYEDWQETDTSGIGGMFVANNSTLPGSLGGLFGQQLRAQKGSSAFFVGNRRARCGQFWPHMQFSEEDCLDRQEFVCSRPRKAPVEVDEAIRSDGGFVLSGRRARGDAENTVRTWTFRTISSSVPQFGLSQKRVVTTEKVLYYQGEPCRTFDPFHTSEVHLNHRVFLKCKVYLWSRS
jgi:hypothetical protein